MAIFILKNIPAYNENVTIISESLSENHCFCCLAQNEDMVDLKTCKHNGFLQQYNKLELRKMLVCHICHKILKNIDDFKNQVAECSQIMYTKREIHRDLTKYKLQKSLTTITSFPAIDLKSWIKEELDTDNIKNETVNNSQEESIIKQGLLEVTPDLIMDSENSSDNDLPLSQLKKSPKRHDSIRKRHWLEEKYDGKIKVVHLSKKEFMTARERESKKKSYLKLPFKCKMCIKGFTDQDVLKAHMEKNHGDNGDYRCDICQSVFSLVKSYRDHCKRHLRRYECVVCGKRASDIYTITHHYYQQHKCEFDEIDVEFHCEQCNYSTNCHKSYRYHRNHHNTHKCNECGETFGTITLLKAHIKSVHTQSETIYSCPSCDKTYKSKSSLYCHTATVHVPNSAGGQCAACRTYFDTRHSSTPHVCTRTEDTDVDERFECQACNLFFDEESNFKAHIKKKHSHTDRNQCNICSKIFKAPLFLKKHIQRVHEKRKSPKNKVCDYCGRAFTTQRILMNHIRTHTGERPFKCTTCGATFTQSGALFTHNKLKHS